MASGSPALGLPLSPHPGDRTTSPSAAATARVVPLTCHGHSRPVPHISFSSIVEDDQYYLLSACKDGNPMLRDGITGDWIGTFLGHKGAVWQARLSYDVSLAATASADFSAKIWDTHTGECLTTLEHNHIVRSVAFSPPSNQSPTFNSPPTRLITGGNEKKLRIFDLTREDTPSVEIGAGTHQGTIKSVVWTEPNTILSASEDRGIRWWDLRVRDAIDSFTVDEMITSCELSVLSGGSPVGSSSSQIVTATAGKKIYFFHAATRQLIKSFSTKYNVSSASLNPETRQFVMGTESDTWVHLFDFDSGQEIDVPGKGHHGPVWSVSFSPDGKLYATGSEDGTIKLWKYGAAPYGLWK